MLEKLTDNTIETQRKWLKFILERVGHNNLEKLIDYYEGIGWISASVADRLLALANKEKRYIGTSWTLSAEEHRVSRLYIEKLGGKQIDDSFLSVPPQKRAVPESARRIPVRLKENILPMHPVEKKKMEFAIHRREVTINNLEQELEDKEIEIKKLQKVMRKLEFQLEECHKEAGKNRIFMGILDQNTRLKKVERINRKKSGIK